MKRSKRYTALAAKIDAKKAYTVVEAITLLKENKSTKFDETIELHFKLGIDPRKGDQQIRNTVVLPHGTGKQKKVVVFAEGEAAEEAIKEGADKVGSEELIAEIKQAGKCDFDEALATPDMMRKLSSIAKILGTKGIMPNPKKETIITNVAAAVKAVKGGKVAFRNDDTSNIHQAVGKLSFDNTKLEENVARFVNAVLKARPSGQKGIYIKSATMTSSMSPGIKFIVEKT